MRARAIAPWSASYPDPVAFHADEAVRLTGREDAWDGHRWLWAVAGGREGWVPDDAVAGGVALRDFAARELSVAAGEVVEVLERGHGWARCRTAEGAEGWVPEVCLSLAV